jgi:hypothetical protein
VAGARGRAARLEARRARPAGVRGERRTARRAARHVVHVRACAWAQVAEHRGARAREGRGGVARGARGRAAFRGREKRREEKGGGKRKKGRKKEKEERKRKKEGGRLGKKKRKEMGGRKREKEGEREREGERRVGADRGGDRGRSATRVCYPRAARDERNRAGADHGRNGRACSSATVRNWTVVKPSVGLKGLGLGFDERSTLACDLIWRVFQGVTTVRDDPDLWRGGCRHICMMGYLIL